MSHMSRRFILTTVVALSLFAAGSLHGQAIDINGGLSWGGWTFYGNSRAAGIWAADSTTRDFDIYTTVFYFDNNQITGNPTQVKAGSAPEGFAAGPNSPGAFANSDVILGIGLKMKDLNAGAIGQTFVNFGIGGGNYQAATALGAADGRTDNTVWAHTGDFGTWMDGTGVGPSNLYAMTSDGTAHGGSGVSSNLPGGFGSGVSYDYAFRMFRQGDAGGSIQFFYDLTAMQALYGPGNTSAKWNPSAAAIGAIDLSTPSNLTISLYNSNVGFGNGSTAVIGPISVPEPSTVALAGIGALALGAGAIRRNRKAR
jgi:hypothetical protein